MNTGSYINSKEELKMEMVEIDGYKFIDGGVCAAKGFTANGVCCGLAHKPLTESERSSAAANNAMPSKGKKNDLAVIYSEIPAAAACVYTTNKVKGAPVEVTKRHLENKTAQAVIVNSVNANTCNADGVEKAERMCSLAAAQLGLNPDDVIVASTGVIGQILPIEPIEKAVPELCAGLSEKNNAAAVNAIMTTDTMPKEAAVEFEIDGIICHLGGMLKGSGMIHPNMATTLSFITSDIDISPQMLQLALSGAVNDTLNCVSVDGDQSTNDMCCIMANGLAGNRKITEPDDDYEIFYEALYTVLANLARMMARDGEGATKLITCNCVGAPDEKTARAVSKSVITSSLFKAAMFGEDANWGRILCAVGYADAEFDIDKVDVKIISKAGKTDVCKNGRGVEFSEELAKKILHEEEIFILIDLNSGEDGALAWGCDLSYDYVKINGDYRS